MSAEIVVALVGALALVVAAAITTLVPLLLRRTQGAAVDAVEAEGELTREHLDAHSAVLNSRIDDVRDDLDEVRESVARVREWQAGHDAEHLLIGRPTSGGENE
ncbi:hypothetical protein [Streptomyces albipurpureus]|uniref:Secreted protein n=1 Tax=Streptomyces albipurpureus TaxID=2897419 RepID=A0ABT0UUR9_9ACTN|nr:hypothetical protein [Streptomyces sp. CWNU-1]MCM2391719.1 hypothetical protein [Streptomyces sp. CWNU-1]